MVKFWNERGNLTVHEGLLLRGKQIVIPSSLRTDVLRHLHDGHQGITKTRENANSSVWWPGLSKDIEKTVKNCVVCEKYRRERVEPMKGTEKTLVASRCGLLFPQGVNISSHDRLLLPRCRNMPGNEKGGHG